MAGIYLNSLYFGILEVAVEGKAMGNRAIAHPRTKTKHGDILITVVGHQHAGHRFDGGHIFIILSLLLVGKKVEQQTHTITMCFEGPLQMPSSLISTIFRSKVAPPIPPTHTPKQSETFPGFHLGGGG